MNNRFSAMFYGLLAVAGLLVVGCELKSADSTIREVGVDFSGYYDSTATNADFVSPANSGGRVTSFNLRQTGDQLEAIDNHQYVFRGTIGEAQSDGGAATASFTLYGETTVGQSVTIAGTLAGQGNAATMTGTWIEPDRYCYLRGDATINTIQTNTPEPDAVGLVANTSSISVGEGVNLTASGASSYNWTASGTASGSFEDSSPSDGNNRWVATGAGSATLTAADSSDTSRAASVTVTVGTIASNSTASAGSSTTITIPMP